MRRRLVVTFLFLAVVAGCSARRGPAPREVSGFLDDYSLLRAGAPGEVALVSRNPKADWASYDKVLLEPITLWRSGRKSLDAVPDPGRAAGAWRCGDWSGRWRASPGDTPPHRGGRDRGCDPCRPEQRALGGRRAA